MYENAVPVYEMKNKLSFYLHKAETDGPVFISNHGKTCYVIQTTKDYEEMCKPKTEEKTIFEIVSEMRKKYGLENDDFDYTEFFDSLRDKTPCVNDSDIHIFDEE